MRRSLVLLLLVLACSPKEPRTAGTKVTLNINPTLSYAPLVIAKEEGFFAAEGIDAQLVSLESNAALAALVAGKIDVLSTGVRSGVFNTILAGKPIRIVADKGHSGTTCTGEAFIAPVEMAKRIAAKNGDLRGERVALVRGGVAEFLVASLLKQRNLRYEDVVTIPMPQGTHVSTREEVNAVRYVGEPNLSALLSEGRNAVIATTEEVAPGHQSSVLIYGNRLLRTNPELGRRFMRAYLRGVRQYNAGKTHRNVTIISGYTKLPEDIVRRACWTSIAGHGRIDPAAVTPFLHWAFQRHYIESALSSTQWWAPQFVDDANRTLAAAAQ